MAPRVDFRHVRQHGSFEAVAAAYNIELKKDGPRPGQFKALCPFHEDTKPSLGINTEKNAYQCFACGAKGNILEFVREMEGLGEKDLRSAALKLAEISGISPAPGGDVAPSRRRVSKAEARKPADAAPPPAPPAAETPPDEALDGDPYNRVLTFELKTELDDALKVWLEGRGIDHHAQNIFGLGRASKRSKTIGDRLAIPIHNAKGELVAYCGRYVGDDIPDDEPKYRLPGGFRKELEVFNLHRAVEKLDRFRTVLVFESYLSVMRHHRHNACISFMGRDASQRQVELVVDHLKAAGAARAFVIADGDDPGRTGARAIAGALAPHLWSRVLDLADGEKPHRLDWDELSARLKEQW